MEKLDNIGGLWLQTSKTNVKYFSGKIGNKKIIVFKNKNKKSDKQPDFLIYTDHQSTNQQQEEDTQRINDIFYDGDIPF